MFGTCGNFILSHCYLVSSFIKVCNIFMFSLTSIFHLQGTTDVNYQYKAPIHTCNYILNTIYICSESILTVWTPSISRPLAARSVANNTSTSPDLNFSRASNLFTKRSRTLKLNKQLIMTRSTTSVLQANLQYYLHSIWSFFFFNFQNCVTFFKYPYCSKFL